MPTTETLIIPTITGPLFETAVSGKEAIAVKTGKKRGRKPFPFLAKPTPSTKVLSALREQTRLSFDNLQGATKLNLR